LHKKDDTHLTSLCLKAAVHRQWAYCAIFTLDLLRGLNSGKTYKYAVQAKVNGKWTTIVTTSTATVKVK